MTSQDAALLVLADGTVFRGRSIGARGTAVGEVVFNTAITGYQEILTDPSYCRQLVTLTYPHIGNTGVNDEDPESDRVYAEALIVRDVPRRHSSWRARADLTSYLVEHNIPGIADIDTRKLTRILREKGAQNGCLLAGDVDTGKALLRDYINATIGFEELSRRTKRPAKSLMRMLGPRGNPQARHLLAVLDALQRATGVQLQVRAVGQAA